MDAISKLQSAEETVEKHRTSLGPSHADTLDATFDLALVHLKHFNYDQGFNLLLEIYPLQVLLHGHAHQDPMKTLNAICRPDLTEDFVSFHVLKSAKAFFDQLCPELGHHVSKTDILLLKSRWTQGYLHGIVNTEIFEAIEIMQAAYNDFVEAHGEEDFEGQLMGWGLAMQHVKGHKLQVAKPLLDKLYPALTAQLKDHNRLLYILKRDMALYGYMAKDDDDGKVDSTTSEAKAYGTLQKLYREAFTNLPPDDPTVLVLLEATFPLLQIIKYWGDHEDGDLDDFEQAYNRLVQVCGPDHPRTVRALALLSKTHGIFGFTKTLFTSLEVCGKAVAKAVEVLGNDHETTVKAKQGLGCVQAKLKNKAEARKYLKEALETMKALKGKEHIDFGNLCWHVKSGYALTGDFKTVAKVTKASHIATMKTYDKDHEQHLFHKRILEQNEKIGQDDLMFLMMADCTIKNSVNRNNR